MLLQLAFVTLLSNLSQAQAESAVIEKARQVVGDQAAIVYSGPNGEIRYLKGKLGYVGPSSTAAANFVQNLLLRLGQSPVGNFSVVLDDRDSKGLRHVRLRRLFNNIPIEGDEIRLHISTSNGQVRLLEIDLTKGEFSNLTQPRLAEAEAVLLARQGYLGELKSPPQSSLVFVRSSYKSQVSRLAYKVHIAHSVAPGELPVNKNVFVDALNGRILRELSLIRTAPATMSSTDLFGRQVTLNVSTSAQEVLMINEIMPPQGSVTTTNGDFYDSVYTTPDLSTPFDDSTAVSGHDNLHKSLTFFEDVFYWTAWDYNYTPVRNGGKIYARIHDPWAVGNAYFTVDYEGGQTVGMVGYGDSDGMFMKDLARCYDVTVHEMGHGVVWATADFEYSFQPGALNEHFADVFAWLADQEDDLIGEDCVMPASAPAIRDMCQPANVPNPQPEHMQEYMNFPDDSEDSDWGGVHYNSGIPNKAACLARSSVGAGKVGQVWFRALRYHLGVESVFSDMVLAILDSCEELYGAGATACGSVATAWKNVGLGIEPAGTCPANADKRYNLCFCKTGYQVNYSGDACVQYTEVGCPPHSHPDGNYCICEEGYEVNDDNTACEPIDCPAHAHLEGSQCECDDGYEMNLSGTRCDPVDCPEHAHFDFDGCYCDEGYHFDSTGEICLPDTPECSEHSHPVGAFCVCDEGYYFDEDQNCIPIPQKSCECDLTTKCDDACYCDPECDESDSGCAVMGLGSGPRREGRGFGFSAIALLFFLRLRRRRGALKKSIC